MGEARYLGEAVTAPQYTLLDLGSFPGMIQGGTTAVHGELYEVGPELLARLDRHEGVPKFYVRTTIPLSTGHSADGYLLIDEGRIICGTPLPSGAWLVFNRDEESA